MSYFKEIWNYREMIVSLVIRDVKGRYKGSVLGFFWTFLNPLLQLAVYTLVFSTIMRNDIEDYYLFLFVALIPWLFFSTSLSSGTNCIISQQEMVKKIYFPREVLPISLVSSQFVNMLLSFIVVFVVLFFSSRGIKLNVLFFLPLVMVIEYILTLGLVFILCALTVYFRDLEYVISIVAMAWYFLTPVLYSTSQIPEKLRKFFLLNPMTPIITAYRDILYYGTAPQLSTLLHALIFGIVVLILGMIIFRRLQRHFVEEL